MNNLHKVKNVNIADILSVFLGKEFLVEDISSYYNNGCLGSNIDDCNYALKITRLIDGNIFLLAAEPDAENCYRVQFDTAFSGIQENLGQEALEILRSRSDVITISK